MCASGFLLLPSGRTVRARTRFLDTTASEYSKSRFADIVSLGRANASASAISFKGRPPGCTKQQAFGGAAFVVAIVSAAAAAAAMDS